MLNQALKLTRQFHRMSQAALAEKLSISKSYLSELESGKKIPTIDILERYSATFKVPTSSFLIFSENIATGETAFKPAKKALRIMEWIAESADEEN
ncbi:helix-turn-helix domain-containing protein [Allochromatium vinosum]|uniref:Transcriptional regulator, XRE family n=1 Tax=Allochromatium vinosum (strain ATCC 17899 / DSM 180 / NBRC 103801 / NCIMB 10441 / D) TaxID=572477 RepID=D3RQK7_ALLVD|nr:helix-turn-helix transcriptional regulator [Allochromatium vinosum]ADC63691.1 transcriptional regulator, XRE family [Allochromatium vinosum DSM 180]MBK1656501.1 XRE family transcriptional regulator [Allochromatium vinosum]